MRLCGSTLWRDVCGPELRAPERSTLPTRRVGVVGDGDLLHRIATEFRTSSIGLDEVLPGECDGVVIGVGAEPPPNPKPLTDMTEAEWRDAAEHAPQRFLRALQRARTSLLPRRGSIIVVAPSVGLIGAGDLSHYVTGIEAVRAMAKSAARQWASENISVNLLIVPLALLVGGLNDVVRHVGSATRKDADLEDAAVRAVEFILSGVGPSLTGSSLIVDGGAVMMP